MPGLRDGDAGHLANALLHVGDTFERHLPGTHVFDGHVRGDTFGLQATFRFEVLACRHRHRGKNPIVRFQFYMQFRHFRRNPDVEPAGNVRDIRNEQRAGTRNEIEFEASRRVGRRTFRRAVHGDGGPDKCFLRHLIDDHTFERSGSGDSGSP